MEKIRVYDLPTRLFHWVLVATFVSAFIIGENVDDESVTFSYHMMLGMVMSLAIVLRLIWGVVGSKHARFSNFVLNPASLIEYFKYLRAKGARIYVGHNPASSWAAVAMLTFGLGLGLTGFLMTSGQKETFEDVHEVLGKLFLVTALGHVVGVVFHMLKHNDPIGLSMVTGVKNVSKSEKEAPVDSHVMVGVVFAVILGVFAVQIYKNFDPTTRNLNLFGTQLTLGETEHDKQGKSTERQEGQRGDDDDDDDNH